MKFVAPTPTPKGIARRVPPAIFVPVMGILGLGLAFRQAAWHWPPLAPVSELILGAASLLTLVALAAYGMKVGRRPGVLVEELAVLPGRLGLSALAVCLYLMAAAVGSFLPATGWLFLGLGLSVQAGVMLGMTRFFLRQPPQARRMSAAGQIYFTSPIVAALAAITLGATGLAQGLAVASLAAALVNWGLGASGLWRGGPSAPLRPLVMLHLAAASVAGAVALGLGWNLLAEGLALLSVLMAIALALALPSLTEAPFSALWGAFTFPVAATAGFWLAHGGPLLWPGAALLAVASLVVPVIAFRILKLWLGGQLAIKTNAASA